MRWLNLLALAAGLSLVAGLTTRAEDKERPREKDAPAPAITISGPYTHANLSIFLMHGKDAVPSGRTLLTLQEAMEQKKLVVHETSNVNELSVENISPDIDVFIQSGDIVRGGKQDRLMAVDLIVPPKSGKTPIASFCCEAGRWRKRGGENEAAFGESSKQAANKDVKLAVNAARDQGQVWEKVKEAQKKLAMNLGKSVNAPESPSSYQLSLEDKELMTKLSAYENELKKAIEGKTDVIGFAIVINGKVEGAEVYGSAQLFRKLCPKLINAAAVDALSEVKKDAKFTAATTKDVEKFLAEAEQGKKSEVALARAQNQEINRPPNPAAGQGAGIAASGSPPAEAKPGRISLTQRDSAKILMLECQDKQAGNAVIHRSYIAK
jgi:hypothetical protein